MKLRGLTALAASVACALGAPVAASAQATPPSLRLMSASPQVTLTREGRLVPLDLGVLVASVGGDFQLNVVRPDYDSPRVVRQVDAATGAVLRTLPADVLRGWGGLRDFVRIGLRTRAGRLVAWRTLDFCPNAGGGGQRTTDDGPAHSRYPSFCSGGGSPFLRGMVWGIDRGWAVDPLRSGEEYGKYGELRASAGERLGTRYLRVKNGRYVATVKIAPRYAQLLGVSAADAQVSVKVTVRGRMRHGGTPDTVVVGMGRHAAEAEGAAQTAPVPDVASPDPQTLPDLVALPAWQVTLMRHGRREYLGFAATPWNAGPAPMVVEGFRKPNEALMDAYQYFFDADGDVVGRTAVGAMEYDTRRGHDHWHFLQFSSYTLVDAEQREVVRSRKQAFCLVPTDAIDLTVRSTNWTPQNIGFGGSVCGARNAIWVREQLDVGWGDTYFQGVPGQSFDVTNLPNGLYYIRIDVNPLGVLKEASLANNTELRAVELRGRPGKRRIVVHPWHSIRS